MIKDTAANAKDALEDKEVAAIVLKEIGITITAPSRMAIEQNTKQPRLPIASQLSKKSLAAIHEVESGHAKKVSHRIEPRLPTGKLDIAKI